jgi:hypothetical protein
LEAESQVSNSSPSGQYVERIERLALLFAGIANCLVRLFNKDDPDPQGSSNRKKGKSNKRSDRRQSNVAVMKFAIGAVSIVFISAIIVMAVAGLSAKTVVLLATSTIIFAIVVRAAFRA